jgi:hypothetical protein
MSCRSPDWFSRCRDRAWRYPSAKCGDGTSGNRSRQVAAIASSHRVQAMTCEKDARHRGRSVRRRDSGPVFRRAGRSQAVKRRLLNTDSSGHRSLDQVADQFG